MSSSAPSGEPISAASTSSLPPPPPPTSSTTAKLQGYDLYRAMGSPKHVLAPMVDASELAWRIFSRVPVAPPKANGKGKNVELTPTPAASELELDPKLVAAELCYTPMINAKFFGDLDVKNTKLRDAFDLVTDEEGSPDPFSGFGVTDRPLIAQFCANDPEKLLASARRIQHRCDAVDLNIGCPQGIARKGQYGAFLMEDWDLIYKLVNTLHVNLDIPVTAKFRVYDTTEKTVEYALMLERAGAQILTCHGRTRDMKGHKTGFADWEKIRAVKQAVKVPVFANGNILYFDDVQKCLDFTGCDGVMSAEGNLYNPSLFLPPPFEHSPVIPLAHRYLDVVASLDTNTSPSAIKGHLFKMLGPALEREEMREMRDKFSMGVRGGGKAPADGGKEGHGDRIVDGWRALVTELEAKVLAHLASLPAFPPDTLASDPSSPYPVPKSFPLDPTTGLRVIPFWLSQPHVRPLDLQPDTPLDPSLPTPTAVTKKTLHCTASPTQLTHPCSNISATLCPNSACLTHCRLLGAISAAPSSGYPSPADAALLTPEQVALLGKKEWEGFGCESHEEKVRARKEAKAGMAEERKRRKKELNAEKAERREQNGGGVAAKGQQGGGKKRKGKGGSGSEGEGPVLGVVGGEEKKGRTAKKGVEVVEVMVEPPQGGTEEEEAEMEALAAGA